MPPAPNTKKTFLNIPRWIYLAVIMACLLVVASFAPRWTLQINSRSQPATQPPIATPVTPNLPVAPPPPPAQAAGTFPRPEALVVPILLYHYTPTDFEAQVITLKQKGYSFISPDDLVAAFNGQIVLAPKPLIITYDDGYANQMAAYNIMRNHGVKGTFYIITGGEASHWCIGTGRRYDQPAPCGDTYLTWDQVIQMDRGGMTIGAHTANHLHLEQLEPSAQFNEMIASRDELASHLGHPVQHFAYPYGSFSGATVALADRAGFNTAVTTNEGVLQTPGGRLTLSRVRDAYALP